MKINGGSKLAACAEVYLDGEELAASGYVMAADEEKGQVLMLKRDSNDRIVPGYDAEVGDLVARDDVVYLREGRVEIKVSKGCADHFDEQNIRKGWEESFVPIQVMKKTEQGLEPAFEF